MRMLRFAIASRRERKKCKGKASSLDIAPLTILNSGALQPRKWQPTGNDCSTAVCFFIILYYVYDFIIK